MLEKGKRTPPPNQTLHGSQLLYARTTVRILSTESGHSGADVVPRAMLLSDSCLDCPGLVDAVAAALECVRERQVRARRRFPIPGDLDTAGFRGAVQGWDSGSVYKRTQVGGG
jgi:hypothetical protein